MKQPPWYTAQGELSKVCFLRRPIYGLKQSRCIWFVDKLYLGLFLVVVIN